MASSKSNLITAAYAAAYAPVKSQTDYANLHGGTATIETAAADDAGHIYRMHRVHSSWLIRKLEKAHDDVTNMSTADFGLYDAGDADDVGAVVDVDFFADAVDISSASSGFGEITYERDNTRIADCTKPLWEQLGLTEDPGKWYEICVTATTNDPTAAKTISTRLEVANN